MSENIDGLAAALRDYSHSAGRGYALGASAESTLLEAASALLQLRDERDEARADADMWPDRPVLFKPMPEP